jgi:hypothetical protein
MSVDRYIRADRVRAAEAAGGRFAVGEEVEWAVVVLRRVLTEHTWNVSLVSHLARMFVSPSKLVACLASTSRRVMACHVRPCVCTKRPGHWLLQRLPRWSATGVPLRRNLCGYTWRTYKFLGGLEEGGPPLMWYW